MPFPSSPSHGDTHVTELGVSFKYDSGDNKWYVVGASITTGISHATLSELNQPSHHGWAYHTGEIDALITGFSGDWASASGVLADYPVVSGDWASSSGIIADYPVVSGVVSEISGDFLNVSGDFAADNVHNITLETGLTPDHSVQGTKTAQYVSAGVVFGNVLTLSGDTAYVLAASGAVVTMPAFAMATSTTSSGSVANMLLHGTATDDSWSWDVTRGGTGALLYVGSGVITQTRPTVVGDQVQIVGYALSTGEIMFNPNLPWAEIGA